MDKEPIPTRISIRIKKVLILFYLFFLLFFFILPISNANPVTVETMGSGQLIPQYETRVYLKSEDISANISEIVTERTEYVLKNSENSISNLSIALPLGIKHFDYNLPENVTLTIDGIVGEYIWGTFNYTSTSGYNYTCFAIIFNLTFTPFEEKIIVANYSRHFSFMEGLRSYHYITETGRFWNRSIEYARFNYRLSLHMGMISIGGLETFSSHFERNELVISKEFFDWLPTTNIGIIFDSRQNSSSLLPKLIILSFILIVFSIGLLFIRSSMKLTNKNNKKINAATLAFYRQFFS